MGQVSPAALDDASMAYGAPPKIKGATIGINCRFNRCASSIRCARAAACAGIFLLTAVIRRSEREWQLAYDVSVEIEGVHEPSLAATWLTMQVAG